jgi:nucleoid DNA-binding protein
MATLTKRELVVRISSETGLVQAKVFEVIQRTLDLITEALARGEHVELRNFGVLEVRLSKPRIGRNPNKPESSFVIPPRAAVKFKAGKVMRQKVLKLSAALKKNEGKK